MVFYRLLEENDAEASKNHPSNTILSLTIAYNLKPALYSFWDQRVRNECYQGHGQG